MFELHERRDCLAIDPDERVFQLLADACQRPLIAIPSPRSGTTRGLTKKRIPCLTKEILHIPFRLHVTQSMSPPCFQSYDTHTIIRLEQLKTQRLYSSSNPQNPNHQPPLRPQNRIRIRQLNILIPINPLHPDKPKPRDHLHKNNLHLDVGKRAPDTHPRPKDEGRQREWVIFRRDGVVPSLGFEFIGVGTPDCGVAVDYEGDEVEGCSGWDGGVGEGYWVGCCSGDLEGWEGG